MTLINSFADIKLSLVVATHTSEMPAIKLEEYLSQMLPPELFEVIVDEHPKDHRAEVMGAVPKGRLAVNDLCDLWPRARVCMVVVSQTIHYPRIAYEYPNIVAIASGPLHTRAAERVLNPTCHASLAQDRRIPKMLSVNESRREMKRFLRDMLSWSRRKKALTRPSQAPRLEHK